MPKETSGGEKIGKEPGKETPKDARAEVVPATEKRYVLVELSCDFRQCTPCTYPNCSRFVRETKKKKPFSTRIFEVDKAHWEKATTKK